MSGNGPSLFMTGQDSPTGCALFGPALHEKHPQAPHRGRKRVIPIFSGKLYKSDGYRMRRESFAVVAYRAEVLTSRTVDVDVPPVARTV